MTATHHTFMLLALSLAEQGRLTVSPNPMVGCVIVNNGEIVGRGFHQRAGEHHAEILALKDAGARAQNAIAYITLEPCCHQGKTPPCTEAFIKAGIKKIYIACKDPNPLVAGKGIEKLKSAGIEIELGLCAAEASAQNEVFFHYIKHKRPFVIAKWAMSLDGRTQTHITDSKQISCDESAHHTHQLRSQVDAILVGANTARMDNPRLTARIISDVSYTQPIRIILAGNQIFPNDLQVFNDSLSNKTILVVTKRHKNNFKNLSHVKQLIVPENNSQQISLPHLMDELGKREIASILVEGGMQIHQRFFAENLVNKIQVYIAPAFVGTLEKKRYFEIEDFSRLGRDYQCAVSIKENNHV